MSDQRIEFLVRGVVLRDGAVLVCRNIKHGYVYLPGGHIEFGESAATALEREMREETGRACTVGRLIGAHEESFEQNGRRRHELNVVFHVEHLEGTEDGGPVESVERHIAFDWLDLGGVISADLRPTSVRAWLASGGAGEPTATWWSSMA